MANLDAVFFKKNGIGFFATSLVPLCNTAPALATLFSDQKMGVRM